MFRLLFVAFGEERGIQSTYVGDDDVIANDFWVSFDIL